MSKLLKDLFLKVTARYTKNRFTDVEVHQNPFGQTSNVNNQQH